MCRADITRLEWYATSRTSTIPSGVSLEDVSFTTLACVAMNGLRRAGFTWGESVAVFGLGVVGQLAARLAAIAGATVVHGLERSNIRRSKLPGQPPFHALLGDMDSALAAVQASTRGLGVDLVVEATGAPDLIAAEIAFLRDQGRLLLLSSPLSASTFDFHDLCNRRSLSIIGAHGFSQPLGPTPDNPWTRQRNGDFFLSLLADGRAEVGELVTHRFHGEHARDAYALLAQRPEDVQAVILDWS